MKIKIYTLTAVAILSTLAACSKGPEWKGEFGQKLQDRIGDNLRITGIEIEQKKDSDEFFFIADAKTSRDLYESVGSDWAVKLVEAKLNADDLDDKLFRATDNFPNDKKIVKLVTKEGTPVKIKGAGVAKGMKGNWQMGLANLQKEGDVEGEVMPEGALLEGSPEAEAYLKKQQEFVEDWIKKVEEAKAAKVKAKADAEAAKKAIEDRFYAAYKTGTTLEGEATYKGKTYQVGITFTEVDSEKRHKGYIFDLNQPEMRVEIKGDVLTYNAAHEDGRFCIDTRAIVRPDREALRKAGDERAFLYNLGGTLELRFYPNKGLLLGKSYIEGYPYSFRVK